MFGACNTMSHNWCPPRLKMAMNNFGGKNFMQPMRRLSVHT